MRKVIIILAFIPLMAWADTPDTIKVDTIAVEVKTRNYIPVQQKMNEQNMRLDSIIIKLRNDTIKK